MENRKQILNFRVLKLNTSLQYSDVHLGVSFQMLSGSANIAVILQNTNKVYKLLALFTFRAVLYQIFPLISFLKCSQQASLPFVVVYSVSQVREIAEELRIIPITG